MCQHDIVSRDSTTAENQGPDSSDLTVNDEHVEEIPDDSCNPSHRGKDRF